MKATYSWAGIGHILFCKNCGAKLKEENGNLRHPNIMGLSKTPTHCMDAGKLFKNYNPVVELEEIHQ